MWGAISCIMQKSKSRRPSGAFMVSMVAICAVASAVLAHIVSVAAVSGDIPLRAPQYVLAACGAVMVAGFAVLFLDNLPRIRDLAEPVFVAGFVALAAGAIAVLLSGAPVVGTRPDDVRLSSIVKMVRQSEVAVAHLEARIALRRQAAIAADRVAAALQAGSAHLRIAVADSRLTVDITHIGAVEGPGVPAKVLSEFSDRLADVALADLPAFESRLAVNGFRLVRSTSEVSARSGVTIVAVR